MRHGTERGRKKEAECVMIIPENEKVRKVCQTDVSIINNIRKGMFRLFKHVERVEENRSIYDGQVNGNRSRGCP